MSATLTIVSLVNKARKKYEAKHQQALLELARHKPGTPLYIVAKREAERLHALLYPDNAHFHDSYDGRSIMSRLGLSWQHPKIAKYIGRDGFMDPRHVAHLLIGLGKKRLDLPTKEQLRALRLPARTELDVQTWHRFYKEKRKALFSLMELSVKMNEPLKFSV